MPAVGTATTPDLSEITPIVIVVSVTPLSVAPSARIAGAAPRLQRADLAVVTERRPARSPWSVRHHHRRRPPLAAGRRAAAARPARRDQTRGGDERERDPPLRSITRVCHLDPRRIFVETVAGQHPRGGAHTRHRERGPSPMIPASRVPRKSRAPTAERPKVRATGRQPTTGSSRGTSSSQYSRRVVKTSRAASNAPRWLSPGRTRSSASGTSVCHVPSRARERNDVVGVAVPEPDRHPDIAQRETPIPREQQRDRESAHRGVCAMRARDRR